MFDPSPKGHVKFLWVPDDEPQEKKKPIPPIAEIDGKKFIGSGEDAHVYLTQQSTEAY